MFRGVAEREALVSAPAALRMVNNVAGYLRYPAEIVTLTEVFQLAHPADVPTGFVSATEGTQLFTFRHAAP